MAIDTGKIKQAVRDAVKQKAAEAGTEVLQKLRPGAAPAATRFATEPVFRSTLPIPQPGKADTLVIMCNSWEWRRHTQEFLATALHITEYDQVAIPGGVQWLALPDILPKHNKVARWMTEYLVRKHNLSRVVCIAHEDCSAYEDHSTLGAIAHVVTGKSVFDHQIDQLRSAARVITESLGVPVELYYASSENGAVVFHKVELQPTERQQP